MQKLQLSICCIFLSAFLASCGQSNVPPVVQTDSVPDTSTQITLQERKDYDVPKPKKDWIEALNTFATDNLDWVHFRGHEVRFRIRIGAHHAKTNQNVHSRV
jgi:hypothetical protein